MAENKTIIEKWQRIQDEIDLYFSNDENYSGFDGCPLIRNPVVHNSDPVNVTFDVEFTWLATHERARVKIAQAEQGSPHFTVESVEEKPLYALEESHQFPRPAHAYMSPEILRGRINIRLNENACGGKNCFECGVLACQRDHDAETYLNEQWFKRIGLK